MRCFRGLRLCVCSRAFALLTHLLLVFVPRGGQDLTIGRVSVGAWVGVDLHEVHGHLATKERHEIQPRRPTSVRARIGVRVPSTTHGHIVRPLVHPMPARSGFARVARVAHDPSGQGPSSTSHGFRVRPRPHHYTSIEGDTPATAGVAGSIMEGAGKSLGAATRKEEEKKQRRPESPRPPRHRGGRRLVRRESTRHRGHLPPPGGAPPSARASPAARAGAEGRHSPSRPRC